MLSFLLVFILAFSQTGDWIATTWWGTRGPPSLYTTATCQNSGPEAVWIAQTGTQFLDIIQIGSVGGKLFYAYGRGNPNEPGSLYVEKMLGPSGTGLHRFILQLKNHIWYLSIDGKIVARISDKFRTWRLRATQIMTEGDLPMGPAFCRFSSGKWNFGGYGPPPPSDFGATWWKVGPF